jgi:hypothetical protein
MKKLLAALLISLALLTPLDARQVLALNKTPYEIFDISVDFTQAINGGTPVLASVTATDAQGNDVTSQLIAPSPVPALVGSTDVVAFAVQQGYAGQTFTISVKVSDSVSGQRFEGTITLTVTQT